MKIAILCAYPLDNNRYTGSLSYVEGLTYHLSFLSEIELHVITFGNETKEFKKGNLSIHVLKRALPASLSIMSETLSLRNEILKLSPDVVHAQGTYYPYSTALTLVKNKYPVILTAFGIIAREIEYEKGFAANIRKLIAKPIERYVLSKIPNIIVEAPSIKDLISKWTKSKIYIAPVGVEYEEIEEIQSHIISEESPDIFIVVNLEKIKGVDILIEAIPAVISSIPSLNVYIAGTGPQEKKLKALVKKLNLEKHVKFLGFISEEEKYHYYKACKLVIVPSRWDCQPFALFDAAASGKPVIASDMSNPGIVEDGKTGFIFKSENVEELASKITMLLKDKKLREEMGRTAKEKVKNYDWNRIAERTVEIYKEAIADFHERKNNK